MAEMPREPKQVRRQDLDCDTLRKAIVNKIEEHGFVRRLVHRES